ncbi:MAG: WD40 repeat domain-containing protein, partial [Ktedonobacteraceae bacterium]
GTTIFGSITVLLDEQWGRLSSLEQTLLSWLATLREPVTLDDLLAMLVTPLAHGQVLEAVDGLRRRSLIERGQRAGSFTLHSVVLEYVTGRLVITASEEIQQGRLLRLREHGFSQAQAKEYVRQAQERLLLVPLLVRLQSVYQGRAEVEGQLHAVLDTLRKRAEEAQGYGPANLVALLRLLRGHLRGLDLSHLALRGAYLQEVELQDATLSGALMRECVFTETFDAITAGAISRSGQYWAAASQRGEVRVWREAGQTLHLVRQAHTDIVTSIAFSPDERTLASGSVDNSVKLWDVASGAALWTGWHTKGTTCLAFAPDGSLLASGGSEATVRLWDAKLGTPLEELPHPGAVLSLAWHPVWGTGNPDGRLLASGDVAGTIRLWERQPTGPATCVQTLVGHTNWVRGLAFAPNGSRLASASWDGTLKLWEVGETGSHRLRQTLVGHTKQVQTLAWHPVWGTGNPDGGTLASGSFDHTIRLWDGKAGTSRVVLQGHSAVVTGLAFTPDSRHLLSGSGDGTLRLWDVERGESLRVMQGYTASLLDLDWSPDGSRLASAGADTLVTLWDVAGARLPRVLRGHRWDVYGVAWSPDGSLLASSGWDNAIRLWDPATGTAVQVLRDLDHPETIFYGVAWSPDGKLLACGSFLQGVLVWDVTRPDPWWVGRARVTWIRRGAWSPDGRSLVGGGDDGHVYVWDAADGTLHQRLAGHYGAVTSVAFSPDGSRLASVGGSRDGGELVVWDAHSGERHPAWHLLRGIGNAGNSASAGHPGVISALTWTPSAERAVRAGTLSGGQVSRSASGDRPVAQGKS